MKKVLKTLWPFGAFFVLATCSPDYEARTVLAGNATATLSVSALFGIHSDWRRSFTISDDGKSVSLDLFEDTGWWRGSHLYLHSSGAYVVHEGQLGCFGFSVKPLSFDVSAPVSCVKIPEAAARFASQNAELQGYPSSKFYPGLYYIGRFIEVRAVPELRETRRETAIVFQSFDAQSEPELPEAL